MNISDILQYPVKGLSPEHLKQVQLTIGAGMPADRLFAITHGKSAFSFDNPAWVERKHFAVVAHSPQIAPIDCQFEPDNQILRLSHLGKELLHACIKDDDFNELLNNAMTSVISSGQPGPYQLVRAGNTRMTDIATPTISIMNAKSLNEVEKAIGKSLDKRRFRGNVWFNGDKPWQEHDWVGKQIQIGDVKLFVTERIQRCAAIDANPELGERDLPVLKQLNQSFGHTDFGVLAQVDVEGVIHVGDELSS